MIYARCERPLPAHIPKDAAERGCSLVAIVDRNPRPGGTPLPDGDGLTADGLRDTFAEVYFGRPHEALELPAADRTPVHAVVAGTVRKLFLSAPGGNTIYEHPDRCAAGPSEGMRVERGDLFVFIGLTGDADRKARAINPWPALPAVCCAENDSRRPPAVT